MTSENYTSLSNRSSLDEELKALALAYIEAHNRKDFTAAEMIRHDIDQLKSLSKHDKKVQD
tara:strand:- start:2863 stop:3045 length:183 start_codon:yes stop_codon:yes gene_type:complete